jgi:VWFA-related protein
MKRLFPPFAIALSLLCAIAAAQKPVPTPPGDQDDVVKISTTLVQVDILVVDKDGRQVTDLKADEFELFQDGKAQKITKFGYFGNPLPPAPGQSTDTLTAKTGVPTSPVSNTVSPSGRLVTFIVDDGNCSLSTVGMAAARDALVKFVNEQMLPNDKVAIYQTRSGSSVLQQYTSDKQRVLQAARKLRWYPPGGTCSSPDGSFFERARTNIVNPVSSQGSAGTKSIESEEDRKRREAGEDFNRNNQTVGTIGVLNYVIRGLETVPGRKMVLFLSDGLPLRSRTGVSSTAMDVMRDLTDRANRGSIVFNTVNVRGTFDAGFVEARDEVDVSGVIDSARPSGTSLITANRERDSRQADEGMFFLSNETGGKYYQGSNYLDGPIDKALRSEQGYYLLGYEPDDDTFKGKNFHKLEVKVSRPGTKVIARSGFLAKPDTETVTKLKTADSELYQAIAAPLPKAGLDLRLMAFFGNTPGEGNFIRSLIALRGSEITFVSDAGGIQKAMFDVVAVTLDEKNKVSDEFNKTHTIKVDPATADFIKANGLVYSVDVPIKKEGTYSLRVAIRDASSKLLGSAGQAILIPELKKGRLYVSGLSISQLDAAGKYARPSLTKPDNGFALNQSKGGPVTRQFKKMSSTAYSYTVYNAGTNTAGLTTQINLYKDGKLMSEGTPKKIEAVPSVPGRIDDYGFLRLTSAVEIGDYTLEIIVRNAAKKEVSSQSVDFEIID